MLPLTPFFEMCRLHADRESAATTVVDTTTVACRRRRLAGGTPRLRPGTRGGGPASWALPAVASMAHLLTNGPRVPGPPGHGTRRRRRDEGLPGRRRGEGRPGHHRR